MVLFLSTAPQKAAGMSWGGKWPGLQSLLRLLAAALFPSAASNPHGRALLAPGAVLYEQMILLHQL